MFRWEKFFFSRTHGFTRTKFSEIEGGHGKSDEDEGGVVEERFTRKQEKTDQILVALLEG